MKYDKLPNIKILDESNKVIHQKSSDVTFPLKEETKKLKSDIEAFLKAREDAFRKDD